MVHPQSRSPQPRATQRSARIWITGGLLLAMVFGLATCIHLRAVGKLQRYQRDLARAGEK